MFGTDTLYLHSVPLCCQECVKVDLGRDIYTKAELRRVEQRGLYWEGCLI